jgi:2-hydroxychromene-2-carboxylate isomerase
VSGILEVHHHPAGTGVPATAPASAAPLFLYDLASPECYLAAERAAEVLGLVAEWEPVLLADLPGAGALDAFRCASERDIHLGELERRATRQGLQAIHWPAEWPADTRLAMSVATYAKQIGRGVAFSLAAFRQAFAAGRDLSDPDSVVIAAAACEMHPAAVLKAAEMRSVRDALAAATARAHDAGVTELPALVSKEGVFQGPAAPEQAAAARSQTG